MEFSTESCLCSELPIPHLLLIRVCGQRTYINRHMVPENERFCSLNERMKWSKVTKWSFHKNSRTQRNGKISHVYGLKESILLKIFIWYKVFYRFNTIYIKSKRNFQRTRIAPQKICMELQKTLNDQINLPEKNRRQYMPDLKIYCKATVMKTARCCPKQKHAD